MKTQIFTVLVALFQVLRLNADLVNVSINARFEPNRVDINREVRYIVEVTNAIPDDFDPPSVPGLRKRNESIYQSSSVINGISSQKISYIFSYIPEKIGTIEIPSYEIMIDGERCPVMPSKLEIVNNSQNSQGTSQQREQRDEQGIVLDVSVNSTRAYVGQYIPAKILVKCGSYVQLTKPIRTQILGDAFLQSALSKQPHSQTERKYEVYSWDIFITPLKNGKHEISFKVTCPVQVLRTMGFLSFAEEETVNLTSTPIPIEINSPPKAPEGFRGGIGKFSLCNFRLSSDRALLGEPVTLSVDIVGAGNFARLQPPEIPGNESWKVVFPPKSTFVAQDDYDFRGTKTMEYVIIPQQTGEIAVPNVALIYFNPETEQYETSTLDNSKKIVLVSRSAETFSNYDNGSSAKNKIDKGNKSKDSIGATHILSKDTQHYATLNPIYCQSWFWILQLILALIASLYFLKIRTPAPKKKIPKWNIKNVQKLLSEIVDNGDGRQFYRTAVEILDQKLSTLGIRGQHHSEQIAQLQTKDIKHLKWLESFWGEADAIAFGQSQVDKKHLKNQLEKLMMFLQQQ
ncbi:MAG: BatD family protein [Puniceicoccales bacterium]|jgi:hypothetical protein|nr:BatD family protein [Puniceicoccales bacterium]